MNIAKAALKKELTTDPMSLGYSSFLINPNQGSWVSLANLINNFAFPGINPGTWVTEVGICAILGGVNGDAFLTALTAYGSNPSNTYASLVNRTLWWLHNGAGIGYPSSGIDLGNSNTQSLLTVLSSTITTPSGFPGWCTSLITAGSRQWSRAEILSGTIGYTVQMSDVSIALNS